MSETQAEGPLSYCLKPFRDVSKATAILTKPIGFLFLLFSPVTSLAVFLFFLTSSTDGRANYTPQS